MKSLSILIWETSYDNLPLWLPQPGVSSKSSTKHPRSSLSECTALGTQKTSDKSKKISSTDSLLRRWRCLASWFVQNDDYFFHLQRTHTHKELLIQSGPIFQKIKNAKPLKKALRIHPRAVWARADCSVGADMVRCIQHGHVICSLQLQ